MCVSPQNPFMGDSVLDMPKVETWGCDDVSDEPWTDPWLGTFARDPGRHCAHSSMTHRSCCRPSPPQDIPIRFIVDNGEDTLASSNYRSERLLTAVRLEDKPVAWIVPGMLTDDFVLLEAVSLSEEFVKKGYNVIYVEWDEISKDFGQSVADAPVVGAMLGSLMLTSGAIDRSLCVGFSFGAHVCAMAGKFAKQQGQVLPRCHLLDPAGPGFDASDASRRIATGDCGVMASVHTTSTTVSNYPTSRIHAPGFGTKRRSDSDCSFVVNEGEALKQPGCFDLRTRHFLTRRINHRSFRQRGPPAQRCSHARALSLYLSSLTESCDLLAHDPKDGSKGMSFPPFDECEPGMNKVLAVNTTMVSEPYC